MRAETEDAPARHRQSTIPWSQPNQLCFNYLMPQAAPMLKQTSNSGSLSEFRDCQTCVARPGSALCAYRGGGAFACESLSSQGTSLNSKFLPFEAPVLNPRKPCIQTHAPFRRG